MHILQFTTTKVGDGREVNGNGAPKVIALPVRDAILRQQTDCFPSRHEFGDGLRAQTAGHFRHRLHPMLVNGIFRQIFDETAVNSNTIRDASTPVVAKRSCTKGSKWSSEKVLHDKFICSRSDVSPAVSKSDSS